MTVDRVKSAPLKRQRSLSYQEDAKRPLTTSRLIDGDEIPSLKRQRLLSEDALVDERDTKIRKFSIDVENEDPSPDYQSDYGSDTDVEPVFDQPPPYMEVDHMKIANLKLISIDEHGHEIIIPRPQPQFGLPTPDPTPALDTATKADPFEQATTNTGKDPTRYQSDVAAQQAEAAHDSPANFAWVGDLKLFGLVPAQLYMYHHVSDELHPYTEIVKLAKTEQISLGTFIPSLEGSEWDMIRLNNMILGWQHRTSRGRARTIRQKGMYLETDIAFQGVLQPVSDFMRDFFRQEHPSLHVMAWLGSTRTYDKVDQPASLILRSTLEHISVNVLDILEFREIGLELTAHQEYDMYEQKASWRFGYGFLGLVNVNVPGTAIPLQAEYCLRKEYKSWMLALRLTDDEWTDVFGVKGLKLSEVMLQAMINSQNPGLSNLSFDIEAAFELRKTKLGIRGSYSKEHFSIEAYVGNLTLHELGEVFTELVGYELGVFGYDVNFNAMVLRVSEKGIELRGQVTINGHTSASGCLTLSKDGIGVSGLVGDLEFDELVIKAAGFDVFIASKSEGARTSRFSIYGDACFGGIEVKVGLYLEKLKEDGSVGWTIYGDVEGDVCTSRMVPELKGTFLDISLQRLALIASNHEAPSGSYPGLQYPVRKGFQFCAAIEGIPELESLMRGSVKGMVLRAMYVPGGNFALSITLPADRTMTFSESVYTGPIEIEIQIGDDVQLVIKAILNMEVDTQKDPLQLSMGLKASTSAASAYAQMLNDWTNPCNMGDKVVIRKCALEFGIVYQTFFATGTPGVIGFAGELAVGSKLAGVAMKVSQNPKEQLLSAQIKDLGVVDLVNFASLVADRDFPLPDDFVHFDDVQLYLSTGTSVGLTYYPAGASLKGVMTLFGKRAQFECTVGSKIKLMATIEQFSVGPLTVKGATKADPIVDIEMSAEKQLVLIDGAIEIWGLSAALHLEAGLYPETKFDFAVDMRLSDLFVLQLEAKLSGKINIKDIKSWATADFEVRGLMEQHIIDHVVTQLDQQIIAARDAMKHGFDDVKKDMEDKEAAFKAACQSAIDELEASRAKWHKKKADIDAGFDSAHEEATRIRRDLQIKVDEAERSFKGLIAEKTAELERSRANAAAAINDAEREVDEAQRDSDNAIRDAQSALQHVRWEFENGFGSAERDLESARYEVEGAQRRVDDLDRDIDHINRRIDDEPWYNCPPLLAEKAGLVAAQAGATAALQVVRGVFFAAEAVVHGTGFVAAEGAIGAAELSLEGVRIAKTEALNLTKAGLEEVGEAQSAVIQVAIDALHAAEHASDELHVFDVARDALQKGEAAAQGIIAGAQSTVDSLAECGEFIAFDAAEKALKFAQDNTSELNLARHAVEVAEGAVNIGLDMAQWAADHAGKLFNITKIEFSGSVRSLVHADESSPPLTATIEGIVWGETINIQIVWKPDFDLVQFIKELFLQLWENIKRFAKEVSRL
ncbi:hypothetical protein GGR53DRAFT_527038 [Hypoxylon sp. FL1150]|nr:hypothetical protein GGR53DRAFT_527038 [Hypoxylon sp. FL1150]